MRSGASHTCDHDPRLRVLLSCLFRLSCQAVEDERNGGEGGAPDRPTCRSFVQGDEDAGSAPEGGGAVVAYEEAAPPPPPNDNPFFGNRHLPRSQREDSQSSNSPRGGRRHQESYLDGVRQHRQSMTAHL